MRRKRTFCPDKNIPFVLYIEKEEFTKSQNDQINAFVLVFSITNVKSSKIFV